MIYYIFIDSNKFNIKKKCFGFYVVIDYKLKIFNF